MDQITSLHPIILVKHSPEAKHKVIFREFIDNGDEMYDIYFSDVWSCYIVGLEQKDGSVVVYKNGVRLSTPVRNRRIFDEKYFTEAL